MCFNSTKNDVDTRIHQFMVDCKALFDQRSKQRFRRLELVDGYLKVRHTIKTVAQLQQHHGIAAISINCVILRFQWWAEQLRASR